MIAHTYGGRQDYVYYRTFKEQEEFKLYYGGQLDKYEPSNQLKRIGFMQHTFEDVFFLLAMRLIWEYHMKMGQPHNYKTQDKLSLNMCIQVFELQETCISSSKTQEEQILYLGLRHKQILQRKIIEPRNTHNHNIMQIVYQMRKIPLQSTI